MLVLFFSTFNAASERLLIVEVEAWYVALGWLTFARARVTQRNRRARA
jgi:hypothetical protein